MSDDGWFENPGRLPNRAKGKKVDVELRNGTVRNGWAADGRGGCRWSIIADERDVRRQFDIKRYRIS